MDRAKFGARAPIVGVLAAMAAAACVSPASAAPKPSFDGPWSVVIVTERGSCGAFGIPLQISQGRVGPRGSAAFEVSGRVGRGGAVTVSVRRGDRSASGHGRLKGRGGAGFWRGGDCSGSWTAAKAY